MAHSRCAVIFLNESTYEFGVTQKGTINVLVAEIGATQEVPSIIGAQ